jgi:CRISPR-associated protein Cas7/Csp1
MKNMKSKINSINVSVEYELGNHNVNASEDGKPKEIDGKAYISGQKIKYMLFQRMKDIISKNGIQTQIPSGDMKTGDLTNDIVSDLGGYMITEKNKDSSTRKSPLDVSFAISKESSNYFDDLFVRFKNFENKNDKEDQRINSKTFSEKDIIPVNYRLSTDEVGTTKHFEIEDNKFVKQFDVLRISNEEKLNRIIYFIESTNGLSGLANTSRNAVENTPKKWFIAFDYVKQFRKYFEMTEDEKKVYLEDLNKRNIKYFEGDSEKKCGLSVEEAVENAVKYLKENKNMIEHIEYNQEMVDKVSQSSKSLIDGK